MSVLSVFNQTATDLLPSRKAAPTEADRAVDFGRELKDADARLGRPQPADDQPKAKTETEKPKATPEASTTTEKTDAPRESNQAKSKDDAPAETKDATDQTDDVTGETPVETDQPVEAETTPTTTEAATTAVSNNQLVDQVLAPVIGESTSQTSRAVSNAISNAAQPAEQVAAANNTAAAATQAATEQAAPVPGALQPQQDKASQTPQANATNQNEPSAASQRIAVVSEARQDTGGQTSGDDAGQQQGALKGNAQAQAAAPITHAPNASFTATTAPVDAASTGTQAFTAVDTTTPTTTTSAQPAPAVPTQDTDNTQLNTARIARGLQNAVHQKGGAVTLRLTPPEMGTVRIQLQIQNGTVNAQFHAETESTRTMLNQQMSHLRAALESQGLSVERLGVQTMQNASGSNLQHESQNGRDGQANDGRSRGGFTQQGNRQGQPSDTPEQQAFEQELNHAA